MITTNYGYNRESSAELGRETVGPQLPHLSFAYLDRTCALNKQGFKSKPGSLSQIWISTKTWLLRLNLNNTSTLKKYLISYETWQFKLGNLSQVKTRF